ncbi:hypothetical protein [Allosphingosinicella deserti]|uniref:Uncharacterized protein n=1 Tax=Allosphingosinicella deserti TaxID=2116704 RepID=A0A2P7QM43_9SPHN|nr:hypothetical protein [Sphingomonas deserti]PSJ39030.1 hypothetical protein C7I55_17180 [Sphingomonas deserti]
MVDRLEQYRRQVIDAVDAWQGYVCNPYIVAYNEAYKNYTDAFNRQKETDKKRAEMFVSIASLLPGSVLMATAANSSLRVLANKVALQGLARANLKLALGAYQAIGASPTAAFAVGKVLDIVKGEAGNAIKDLVTKAMQNSHDTLASDPLSRDKQLESWLITHRLCATDAAEAIENDRRLGEREKQQAFAALKAAPIAQRPHGSIVPKTLSPKIELGFYMMALLDSDELVTQTGGGSPYGGGRTTSKPIDEMPSSPNYPRAKISTAVGGTSSWVGISRPGADVEKRIDECSTLVFKKPFYGPSGWFGKPDTRKMEELHEAERTLRKLADSTRPLSPLGLKS